MPTQRAANQPKRAIRPPARTAPAISVCLENATSSRASPDDAPHAPPAIVLLTYGVDESRLNVETTRRRAAW